MGDPSGFKGEIVKFNEQATFIAPAWFDAEQYATWELEAKMQDYVWCGPPASLRGFVRAMQPSLN